MKSVLISFVGNRDPYAVADDGTQTSGPILSAWQKLKSDVVILIPTKRNGERESETIANANQMKEAFVTFRKSPVVEIYPIPAGVAVSFSGLQRELKDILEAVYGQFPAKGYTYHTVISSGTGQMKMIWLILKDNHLLKGKLYESIDPRFLSPNLSKKRLIEKRTRELELDFLDEWDAMDKVKDYFKNFSFRLCIEELKKISDLTTFSSRKKKAEILIPLFLSYAQWDNMNYSQARENIILTMEEMGRTNDFPGLADLIEEQLETITRLKEDQQAFIQNRSKGSEVLFTDLYYYAWRKFQIGEYVIIPSILTRIYTGIAHYLLWKHHLWTFDHWDIPSVERSEKILYRNNCTVVEKIAQSKKLNINSFSAVKNLRHDSFLTHGNDTASVFEAEGMLNDMRELLRVVFENDENVESYPFGRHLKQYFTENVLNRLN